MVVFAGQRLCVERILDDVLCVFRFLLELPGRLGDLLCGWLDMNIADVVHLLQVLIAWCRTLESSLAQTGILLIVDSRKLLGRCLNCSLMLFGGLLRISKFYLFCDVVFGSIETTPCLYTFCLLIYPLLFWVQTEQIYALFVLNSHKLFEQNAVRMLLDLDVLVVELLQTELRYFCLAVVSVLDVMLFYQNLQQFHL